MCYRAISVLDQLHYLYYRAMSVSVLHSLRYRFMSVYMLLLKVAARTLTGCSISIVRLEIVFP